jgi:hypothetical protein
MESRVFDGDLDDLAAILVVVWGWIPRRKGWRGTSFLRPEPMIVDCGDELMLLIQEELL